MSSHTQRPPEVATTLEPPARPDAGASVADATPDAATPSPLQLPRWKRVLFSMILLVLVLGMMEWGTRIYLRVTRGYSTHLYEFEFDSYKNILPSRNMVDLRGVRHNSQGFRRSSEVSREKPPGTYRIFLMGGSTAYGTGGLFPSVQRDYAVLTNEQTIDYYLERLLRDSLAGMQVEVINAAITSTWTHHHLIYLNQSLLKYDPDMVLFLDGFNDFYQVSESHDQFASYLYNTQAQSIMGPPTLKSLLYANFWWLYRKSALAHESARAARAVKAWLTSGDPEDRPPMNVERAMAGLQRNFPENALKMHRRIGLILQDEGVIPVFMLQPMLVLERDRKPMGEMERRLFQYNIDSYLDGYEEFSHRAVDFVSEREQAMADDVGGEFLDLTGIYAGVEEQIYTDYVHLTPRGNELLAQYVAGRILPLIRAGRDSAATAGTVAN